MTSDSSSDRRVWNHRHRVDVQCHCRHSGVEPLGVLPGPPSHLRVTNHWVRFSCSVASVRRVTISSSSPLLHINVRDADAVSYFTESSFSVLRCTCMLQFERTCAHIEPPKVDPEANMWPLNMPQLHIPECLSPERREVS